MQVMRSFAYFYLLDKWTAPRRSGSVFPPTTCFSIDVVPGSNTAIMFGGMCFKDQKENSTNDVFILSYTKDSVVTKIVIYATNSYR